MKKVGSPKLLFENLDLTPIHSILWTGLHRNGPGRPVKYQPEWDLRVAVEGFIRRVWNRLAFSWLTWQGLENASIYISLVLCVVHAVDLAAARIGRPELRHLYEQLWERLA